MRLNPPIRAAKDSVMETIDAGARLVVLPTEEMSVLDTMQTVAYAKLRGAALVGPGCSGPTISDTTGFLQCCPIQAASAQPVGAIRRGEHNGCLY